MSDSKMSVARDGDIGSQITRTCEVIAAVPGRRLAAEVPHVVALAFRTLSHGLFNGCFPAAGQTFEVARKVRTD